MKDVISKCLEEFRNAKQIWKSMEKENKKTKHHWMSVKLAKSCFDKPPKFLQELKGEKEVVNEKWAQIDLQ